MSADNEIELEYLEGFRDRMVNALLVAITWLGVFLLGASLVRIPEIGWQDFVAWQIGIYVYLAALSLFRNRISYKVRAYSVIAASYIFGVGGMLTWGLLGAGGYHFLLSMTLAILLSGLAAGLWVFAATLAFVAVLGIAVSLGMWTFNFDVAHYAASSTAWISRFLGYVFFLGLILLVLSRAQGMLIKSFASLLASNRMLRKEVAERKKAEELLNQFKTTLDLTHDCVFMFWPDTLRFFYVNQGAVNQVEYTTEELLEMTSLDIKPEFDEKSFRDMIAPLLQGKRSTITFETVHRHKNGSMVPIEVVLQYISPPDGTPRFVAIVRDITERKRAETETQELLRQNRSLTRRMFDIQEKERRAISRELHDELGQWLTAIRAEAEAILGSAEIAQKTQIHACAQAICESATEVQQTIRRMLQHLRPGLLDMLGLAESLRELVAQWRGHHPHIACDIVLGDDLDGLSESLNITVYRLIQEALNNVARHAHARHVTVRLHRERVGTLADDTLLLTVEDDGNGMDPDLPIKGMGVPGMRERTIAAGGEFVLRSTPGQGVLMAVKLPVQCPEEANQGILGTTGPAE